MGKFYQSIQSYGPSFMTKFSSALYLENLLTNIFAKLNLRGGVSCMPAVNFVYEFKPGRSGLGLKMGKFRRICTELWPLIYVKILFPGSILSIY